jgi:hypothetical protein
MALDIKKQRDETTAVVRGNEVVLPVLITDMTLEDFAVAFALSVRAKNGMYNLMWWRNRRNEKTYACDAKKYLIVDFSRLTPKEVLAGQNIGRRTFNEIAEAMGELAALYNYPEELGLEIISNQKSRQLMRDDIEHAIKMLRSKGYIVIPPQKMVSFLNEHSSWGSNNV